MSETRVKRAISKSKPLFVLLTLESKACKGVKPMHLLSKSLLREYVDVFPND